VRSHCAMGFLFLLLTTLSSAAQSQDRPDEPWVRASLFVATEPTTGPFDLGIRFEIEPEWYLYWINPGDAGLPVDVQWKLPEGWTAGPIRFPTPEKMVKGGITAFGYHHELVLLCQITPLLAKGKIPSGAIAARLDWLVCRESCRPGRAEIRLALNKQAQADSALIGVMLQRYLGNFPSQIETSGVRAGAFDVRPDGSDEIVTIPLLGERASAFTDFFPEPIDGYSINLSSVQVTGGRIQMRVTPSSGTSVLRTIRGLAMLGDRGYQMESSSAR
jgi:DsbC/DsbD-like thiol-disulfide interchange protein